MTVTLADIERVVREWHNRHPLALRVRGEAVHSVGWVGLPYMRASQAAEPSMDAPFSPTLPSGKRPPFWQRLGRRPSGTGPWPVFSEAFIDRIRPKQVDAFAARCAWVHVLEGTEGWPLRRIQVDEQLAESCHGAWPTERWLITAAIEYRGQKIRVLVGEAQGHLQVLGRQRYWDPLKLSACAVLVTGAGALALGAVLQRPAAVEEGAAHRPAPAASKASGVLQAPGPASPPSAPAPPSAAAPLTEASGPQSAPASVVPSAPPASAPASATATSLERGSPPLAQGSSSAPPATASAPASTAPLLLPNGEPDIRPRLGPVHKVRPPRPAASELISPPPKGSVRSPKAALLSEPNGPVSRPAAVAGSGRARAGTDTPEHIRAAPATAGPQVALVSPAFAKKTEAEERLSQMQAHLHATVREGDLQGEVFETPQGWRAAVWPFATRAEAQIINATMVARGWKTRAVDF